MVALNRQTTGKEIVAEYGVNAKGKTFVVTGPSEGGLGAELLITLAPAEPAHYILAGRNEAKIQPVIKKINEVNPNIKTTFVHLELSSLASVRKAAAEINAAVDHIDVLVNNAGAGAFKDHRLSEEGIEMHFAANHLGHFLLTNLVVDKVAKVNGTVINLTSMAYALAEFNEDVNFNDGKEYNGWVAYARSKTATILFTYALAEKYREKIFPFAVDPGLVLESQFLPNAGIDEGWFAEGNELNEARKKQIGKPIPETVPVSLQQGVSTSLLVALNPELRDKAPAPFKECAVMPLLDYACDKNEYSRLWAVSEKLIGENFPKA